MKKGVIFDFDGVIADTEPIKFKRFKKILEKYKYNLDEKDFPKFIGKRTAYFLKEKYPSITQETIDAIRAERNNTERTLPEEIKLIPGIIELLGFLKEHKYKVGICSGSEMKFIKNVLEFNNIIQYCDLILSKENDFPSKPNPKCYHTILKRLDLRPSKTIVIEDSKAGIEAGKRAGCRVYAISSYLRNNQLSVANNTFKDHFEILDFFKQQKF